MQDPIFQQVWNSPHRYFYLFTMPGQRCPWCEKAKALLSTRGIRYVEIETPDPRTIRFPNGRVIKRAEKKYLSWPQVYTTTPSQLYLGNVLWLGGYSALENLLSR